jgi:hypothetical protein
MPDTGSILNGKVPWWVQAIGVIGTTATIALYLVWWVTNSVSVSQARTESMLSAHLLASNQQLAVSEQILAAFKDPQAVAEIADFRKAQLELAVQGCINQAKSTTQTKDCIDIGKRHGINIE